MARHLHERQSKKASGCETLSRWRPAPKTLEHPSKRNASSSCDQKID